MDIVKRLRDLGDHASFEPHMHHEAADEIERLRQQNAELMEALRRIANDQDGLDVWSFAEEAIAKATGGE